MGLNVTQGGVSYTAAPTVTISGGGGSGATATAQIAASPSDGIASVVLTSGGSGYTSPPTISIVPNGATFQAVVASTAVTGVTVNPSGSSYCYSGTPTVNFTGGNPLNNNNASAIVSMNANAGCIATAVPNGTCNKTTAGQAYTIVSGGPTGGGSGFTGTVTFKNNHAAQTVSITGVGSGYQNGNGTVTIKDNQNNNCSVTTNFTKGSQVSSISVTSGGAYMTQPTAALGGTAPSAPVTPVLPALQALPNPWPATASSVTAVNLTSAGTGYTPGTHYPLTFTGGGGSGAAGYAVGGGTFVVSGFSCARADSDSLCRLRQRRERNCNYRLWRREHFNGTSVSGYSICDDQEWIQVHDPDGDGGKASVRPESCWRYYTRRSGASGILCRHELK